MDEPYNIKFDYSLPNESESLYDIKIDYNYSYGNNPIDSGSCTPASKASTAIDGLVVTITFADGHIDSFMLPITDYSGDISEKANDVDVLHKTGNSQEVILGNDTAKPLSDFATSSQGAKADSAIQQQDLVDYLNTLDLPSDIDILALEQDIQAHLEDFNNPHQVTKQQVGLGNVDNTSDESKPVSNAQQLAIAQAKNTAINTANLGLSKKVDKVSGSRLINSEEITKISLFDERHYKSPVQTLEELTAIPETDLDDKERRFVGDEKQDYFYIISALQGTVAPDDQTNTQGFWISIEDILKSENIWKDAVDLATTSDITLSGEQTIDGVLTAKSTVLVKDKTDATLNGLYRTSLTGWTRLNAELSGSVIRVKQGSENSNQIFLNTNDSITLGLTPINFINLYNDTQLRADFAAADDDLALQIDAVEEDVLALEASKANDADLKQLELNSEFLSKPTKKGDKFTVLPNVDADGATIGNTGLGYNTLTDEYVISYYSFAKESKLWFYHRASENLIPYTDQGTITPIPDREIDLTAYLDHIQGNTYDTLTNTYWVLGTQKGVASADNARVLINVNDAGTLLESTNLALTFQAGMIVHNPVSDTLLIKGNSGSSLYEINKTTKAIIRTISTHTGNEGLGFDIERQLIWIAGDAGVVKAHNYIDFFEVWTGTFETLPDGGSQNVEGILIDPIDDRILFGFDGYLHGANNNGNALFKFDFGKYLKIPRSRIDAQGIIDDAVSASNEWVKQWGIGTGTIPAYSGDLDALIETSIKFANQSSTNRPNTQSGFLLHIRQSGSTKTQVFYPNNETGTYRRYYAGSWSAWSKTVTEADVKDTARTYTEVQTHAVSPIVPLATQPDHVVPLSQVEGMINRPFKEVNAATYTFVEEDKGLYLLFRSTECVVTIPSGVFSDADELKGFCYSAPLISFTSPSQIVSLGEPKIKTHGHFSIKYISSLIAFLLSGDLLQTDVLSYALSSPSADLVAGDTDSFMCPYNLTLNNYIGAVVEAPTGSSLVIGLKKNGVSVTSTNAAIDATETTSLTGTAPVITTSSFLKGDLITPTIVQVGSLETGKSLKIYLEITKT